MTTMQFPLPPSQYRVADLSLTLWDRSESNQILVLRIDDQGGGCYPVLDLTNSYCSSDAAAAKPGSASFDVEQLEALGQWAKALCAWVDAQEKQP
jgi:hypothetical protein